MTTSERRLSSSSSEDFFKTSSRRLDREKYICLGHRSSVLPRRLEDVLKTSSRYLQDFFKTFCKNVFKTSSRIHSKTRPSGTGGTEGTSAPSKFSAYVPFFCHFLLDESFKCGNQVVTKNVHENQQLKSRAS